MSKATHRRPPPPPPKSPSNGHHHKETSNDDTSSLTAAADLIRTLDSAFADMSSLSALAARDAEDARRNAREASEVARRYTARSYAGTGFGGSAEHEDVQANGGNEEDDDDDARKGGGRKRKIQSNNKIKSSSERIAQSHAEDVLSLSLELERTKQALENERMSQDDIRSSLTEARAKNTQLENQIQKMLNDMETQREDHGRKVDGLQQELNRAQVRVEAAEEDAQLALDLAKGNAESREQLETWLERALHEVESLRGQLDRARLHQGPAWFNGPPNGETHAEPQKRKPVVRFADSPTVVQVPPRDDEPVEFVSTPKSQASRSMVAAGRHLLHRAISESTPQGEKMHSISLTPEKSAERRQKLRQRLQSLDADVDLASPASLQLTFGSAQGIDKVQATKAIESCRSVTRMLRESGRRLGLSGQWWGASPKRGDEDGVESMTRQFCSSVEVSVEGRWTWPLLYKH